MSDAMQTVLIVAGPTASGKSSFALACAAACDGVIINADSMQVYDGLHMLTAQPSAEDFAQIPHELYSILAVGETCSAAKWSALALAQIEAAHHKGQTPILTGGTGFYLKAMTEGLSPIPQVPEAVRAETIALCQKMGRTAFAQALEEKDPEIMTRIDRRNPQRLMRAWEVFEATGKSLAAWQDLPKEGAPENLRFVEVVLNPAREKLYARCDKRFHWMVENGVLDEVTALSKAIASGDVAEDAGLTNALGFWDLKAYLEGETSLEDAIDAAQQLTRRYAKKQTTWFKNQMQNALVIENWGTEPNADKAAVQAVLNRLQD